MYNKHSSPFTNPLKKYPIMTLFWPVQYAWGKTYPKTTTAQVEIIMAKYSGTNLSKKIGKAYKHKALANNNVERSWWWLLKTYKIGFANFFYSSLPEAIQSSIYCLLMAI